MENGVGTVDGCDMGQKRGAEDEIAESKVEEFAKDGFHVSKNSEGDEFFLEATDAEIPTVDSEDVLRRKEENVENLGGSLEVDGNMDVGQGLDRFEDAIEVPSEVRNFGEEHQIAVPDEVQGFVGGDPAEEVKSVGEIDKQSTPEKAARDQLSGLENDEFVDNGKDESKAMGLTNEQISPAKVVREVLNVLENNEIVDNGKDEIKEICEMDTGFELEILKDVDEVNKMSVVLGNSENGVSDNVDLNGSVFHDNAENGDASTKELQSDGELKFSNVDNLEGVAFDSLKEIVTNGDILHQADKNEDDVVDESRNNLLNMESAMKVEQTEEENETLQDTSANFVLENQDGRIGELKSTSASIESDHHVESCKLGDSPHASMEERTVTPEIERQPSLEVEKNDKIRGNTSDLGSENVKEQSADDLGRKELKNDELKQSTLVNREQEIRPAVHVLLSNEKSANLTPSPVPASSPAPAPTRPAGSGHVAPLLESAPRVVLQPRVNGTVSSTQNHVIDDPANGEAEENDETREKLQMIRVNFLRLAHRLGQTPHNVVVAQVLYRLGLAEQLRGRNGGRVGAFSFDRASAMAEHLEAAGQDPLDFSCTIMVLGKTGVGKSATINSIFDEVKFGTDPFQLGTKKVQDVVGTVQGIKVRVIDTPGLLPSWVDQKRNEKILHSVKRFIQKSPPDIVLYLDRLDMQSRDFGDMPLLRTITEIFGPSIWFNAIVVLTHAASAPPEGPNGTATSYDMYVTQRSHVVQQAIRQAAGDMRLMNPVSLVENHSACRTNRAGQRVLPNGQIWKPHLLLLSFASKILAEANLLLKLQDTPAGKPFATRNRAPSLPFLLSNLLQSRQQLKLPQEQFGDDDDTVDDDLDESSDEESSEYDELPPFKRLTNAQLAKLSNAQKKAYYDELEYREKLFMKKQLKEEKKRRKMMKKMAEAATHLPSDYNDNVEEDSGGAATVPVSVHDLNLPASFDSDNPAHRYRSLDSANQWLVRPVLDPHGWDHDVGYEGINVENMLVVKDRIPVSFSGQVTKDKKDANLQMEVASSVKHGEGKSTTLAFDMQTMGKEISYTLRSETRFINYRQNKATAGLSATYFGDVLTGGVKFEDKLMVNKRGQLVVAGGAIIGRGDVAYGGSLEATLRDKDYPLGRFLSTIGLSVMDWHGDLAIGLNAQSQIPIGRFTNLIGRVNLNNRGSGQVSIRLNSSEQLQIALVALIPLVSKLLSYYQPVQYGH